MNNRMRVLTIFLTGILLPFSIQAQDSLKLLSWNVQMLPPALGMGKAKRARAIAEELKKSTYDVVVFQELFYSRSRKIISRNLREFFPHQTSVLNKKSISLKVNGGVMIFSRHPITSVKQIRYKDRTGPDRLARKGALFAELSINGNPLQLIGTHLQAFGKKEIMYSQYKQLHDELLVPNQRSGVPQLICGDFNTLKVVPEILPKDLPINFEERIASYPEMIKTLKAEDGAIHGTQQFTMDRPANDMCKKRKQYRLLLDYFLFSQNQSTAIIHQRKIKIIKRKWHKNHSDLSDHYGLEAIVAGIN
jgi:endonuclease/exonuclease/phosphatase family metal-dependent hydrolase